MSEAKHWNEMHSVGIRVQVTLADGKAIQTRTVSPAQTRVGLDHVQVAGIAGYVLLSWVEPLSHQS